MSTTTIESTGNNGVFTAARLNLVGSRQRVGMPWLILAVIVVITAALDAVSSGDGDGSANSGLLVAFFLMVGMGYLQAMTQTFPFALSLGIPRRTFYLGTGLVVVGETLLHAVALTVLGLVERVTGGWGVNLALFDANVLAQDDPVAQVVAYAGPLVGLSFLALLAGTVFKRWGQPGMYTAALTGVVVFGGLAVLATYLGWWPAVGAFLTGTPTLVLAAVYPLVIALLAGVGGYLVVRRATP